MRAQVGMHLMKRVREAFQARVKVIISPPDPGSAIYQYINEEHVYLSCLIDVFAAIQHNRVEPQIHYGKGVHNGGRNCGGHIAGTNCVKYV